MVGSGLGRNWKVGDLKRPRGCLRRPGDPTDLHGGKAINVGFGGEARALLDDRPGSYDRAGSDHGVVADDGCGLDHRSGADAAAVDHGAGADDHAVVDDEVVVG